MYTRPSPTTRPFLVLVLLSGLVLASCSDGEPAGTSEVATTEEGSTSTESADVTSAPETTTDSSEPTTSDGTIESLHIGTNQFTEGLEATRTSNADAQIQYSIYDTLILRDPFSENLEFLPGLAVSWENVEPTVWEFELRDGVMFHDGTEMDADDVAFSLNRIFENEDARFNNAYGRYFNTFDRVEVVDAETVRIHTLQQDPLVEIFLSDLSGSITSMEYIESVGPDEADRMPVGAGPYQVVSFVPGESAVIERFDDYWGEPAPIDEITFTYIPEIASRVTAVANGEVDMAVGVPTDQADALAGQGGVELVDTAYPLYHVMVMNMGNEFMGSHPLLRQALDKAIDREALNQALWDGKGRVPTSLQFPDYGDMYLPDVETITYDPDEARRLVEESGYDGTTIVVANRADYYVNMDLALQAIIEMWREVGVNAELLQVPDVNDIDDPELMIRTWSNPLYYPDPMGLIDASWSDTIWVSTRGMWQPQNEEWFTNFETARFSPDVEERKEAIRNLNLIAEEEAGFSLLYVPHEYMAVSDHLDYTIPKNYRAYTIGLRAGEIGQAG